MRKEGVYFHNSWPCGGCSASSTHQWCRVTGQLQRAGEANGMLQCNHSTHGAHPPPKLGLPHFVTYWFALCHAASSFVALSGSSGVQECGAHLQVRMGYYLACTVEPSTKRWSAVRALILTFPPHSYVPLFPHLFQRVSVMNSDAWSLFQFNLMLVGKVYHLH